MASSNKAFMSNPTYLGGTLAGQQYQNNVGLPNQYDADAEFFGKIRDKFDTKGKRGSGFQALISGLATGAEYGSKLKGIGMRQDELAKYNKVMDYFMAANMAAQERNEKQQKLAEAKAKAAQKVLGYIQNLPNYDPVTREKDASNILEDYNAMSGKPYKLESIDGANPLKIMIRDGDKVMPLNLALAFADDAAIQAELLTQMPSYQMKMQEERQKRAEDNAYRQQQLALQGRTIDINQGYLDLEKKKAEPRSVENPYGGIALSSLGGKGLTPFMQTINAEKNLAAEIPQVLKMLDEAKQIIKDNPEIGEAWSNLVGGNAVTRSLLGEKKRAAYEKVEKYANRVAEAFIRAKGGNISDSERETIKKGLFDVTQSTEAKLYNIQSVENELKKAALRGQFSSDQLAKGFIYTPQGFEKFLAENPQLLATAGAENQNMVSVVDPSGVAGSIPKENLEEALKMGWQAIP